MVTIDILCPHCGASFNRDYDPENPGNVVVECTGCRTSLSVVNYLSADLNREFYRRQRDARMKRQALPVKMKLGLPSLTHPVQPEESGARSNHIERRPINQPRPVHPRSQAGNSGITRSPMALEMDAAAGAGHSIDAPSTFGAQDSSEDIIIEHNPPPAPVRDQPMALVASAQQFLTEGQNTTAVVNNAGPYVPTAFGDAKIMNPKPLLVGEFGPFQIEAEISRGGMGAVYRAIDTRATDPLQRCVALKVLLSGPAATPEEMSRFKREALAHGKLSHPNLVMVYDAGEVDGRQYIAMELIQGQSLDKLIRLKPMSTHETLQTIQAVCQAMGSAHEQGIIHRDLKPANILIDQMGNPKITDFGLARNLEEITRTTRSGMVMGTPAYMSPEQAEGRSDIGPETDVWSLGTVMYEMLTGKPPFYGDTAIRLALRITQDEPRSPRNLNPEIPMEVEAIVLKCLRKDSSQRYPNAGGLAADIANFLEGRPVRAAMGRRRPMPKMAKLALVGTAVAVFGLAGAWGLSTLFSKSSSAGTELQAGTDYSKALDDGINFAQQGQLEKAEAALRIAATGLKDGKAQFILGQVVGREGIDTAKRTVVNEKKLNEAEMLFAEARRLNPKLAADSYSKMGAIYLACKRDDDAVKNYRLALAAAAGDLDAMCELAGALRASSINKNDPKVLTEARELVRAVLKANPNHPVAIKLAAAIK